MSVIVPAHNADRTVGTAVDSVLGQTFGDLELIVIDDGSADATSDVVRARRDNRVRCVKTENRGVASARNYGLELTSSEFVAFLDADDEWLPPKLERQLALMMNRPSVGLCFTSAEVVNGQLQRTGEDHAGAFSDYTEALLLRGNIVAGGGSSAMSRRSVIESAGGFDTQLSQCADWELWLRLSVGSELAPIPEPLVRYRRTHDTMSGDPALLEHDTFALLDKFFASPASLPYHRVKRRAYGAQWMVCAGTYLHAGQLRDSLRCARRGIAADPRSVSRPLLLPARAASRIWTGRGATLSS